MRALITGASSGIGYDMARELSNLGYDLIVVARTKEKLEELKSSVKTNVSIYTYDLSDINNVYKLYEEIKDEKIDILINNAGYGDFGDYTKTKLDKELNMIDLNVKALHILTKLFIDRDDTKYIMNVASSAGLTRGGPLMATYYATKSYVCNYSFALYEELRRNKSDKSISVLCPGPVDTNFNSRANVKFSLKSLSSEYVAKYAIKKMFKRKLLIIPGLKIKLGMWGYKFLPLKLLLRITYNFQSKKKTP